MFTYGVQEVILGALLCGLFLYGIGLMVWWTLVDIYQRVTKSIWRKK